MIEYRVKLKKREEIAARAMVFYFARPRGFDFIAGQHITVGLINPPETDDEGDKRTFCLASAPYEKDLMIAMRMRDTAFKRVLKAMPLGTEVEITDARGSFVLHEDASKPAVFLAGGIGITPVRSMLLQAAHDNLKHRFYLFYSNRRGEEAAFFDELENLALPHYEFIPVMSEAEGYISKEKLDKNLDDLMGNIYYVVGPPGFVFSMRGMLNEAGIAPKSIKTDQFAGY